MDTRTVGVRMFLPLISSFKNNTITNTLQLDVNPEEYTDNLKVKWYGYENRRGKNHFLLLISGSNITLYI